MSKRSPIVSRERIYVNRFWGLVDGKPLEFVRAIVETEVGDQLGPVIARANDEARATLPEGFSMHLPATGALEPIIVGQGHVQVTWIVTQPVS